MPKNSHWAVSPNRGPGGFCDIESECGMTTELWRVMWSKAEGTHGVRILETSTSKG